MRKSVLFLVLACFAIVIASVAVADITAVTRVTGTLSLYNPVVRQGNAIAYHKTETGEMWLGAVNDGVSPDDLASIDFMDPSSYRQVGTPPSSKQIYASVTIDPAVAAGVVRSKIGTNYVPLQVKISLYKKVGTSWVRVAGPSYWSDRLTDAALNRGGAGIYGPTPGDGEEFKAAVTVRILASGAGRQKGDGTAIFKFRCPITYSVEIPLI